MAPAPPPGLRCTVEGCDRPLEAGAGCLRCPHGHAFDVARSGYVNLLQPQHRRSLDSGDSKAAVEARRRLLDEGFGKPLEQALFALLDEQPPPRGGTVLDVGCGEGTFLASVCARFDLRGCGVDISVHAVAAAAARHRGLSWLVLNADRGLPFEDASFDLVLSIAGRRNPAGIRRVIRPGGRLVAAVPAEDDLFELRELLHGHATIADRFGSLLGDLEGRFRLEARRSRRARRRLAGAGLHDLLLSTYRGGRESERERAAGTAALEVTSSWTLARFRPL